MYHFVDSKLGTERLSNYSRLSSKEGFSGGSVVKNLPANAGDVGLIPGLGRFPGWEDSLEKEMATHSSILAWEIQWT